MTKYMSKSRIVFDKLAKLLEQGIINYKDLSNEIVTILNSKREELIFKMKLTGKEETDIINKRLEKIEERLKKIEKKNIKNKSKKAGKS